MRRGFDVGLPWLIAALITLGGARCSIHEREVGETYDLEGAHGALSCSDCHTDDLQDLPPRSCTGCHEGDLPAPHWDDECDECHGEQVWDDLEYVHEEYELTGAHQEADCGGCHEVAWQSETSCLACHDEDRPLGHIVHECVFCHTTESWEALAWSHDEFPLLGGHSALLCDACHVQGYFGSDVPEKDCVSCHEEQTPEDHDPRPCEVCHNIYNWFDTVDPGGSIPDTLLAAVGPRCVRPWHPLGSEPGGIPMAWRGWIGIGLTIAIGMGVAGCSRPGSSDPAGAGPNAVPAGTIDGDAGAPDVPPAVAEEPTPEPQAIPVLTGPAKYEYTSVALHGDCRRLDTPPEGEPDIAGEYDCPGFAGYQVRIGTADLRSSLSLVKDGKSIHFGSDPEYREPGQFAYVTDKVIEWRYREADGEAHAHALIFRVFGQDPETFEDVSHLIVARLAGTRACVLGTTSSNKEARKLADDPERTCP